MNWDCPHDTPIIQPRNITGQSFDYRNGTLRNSYTYDDLDRLIQADYIDRINEVIT